MEAIIKIIPEKLAYISIPSDSLRYFIDHLFPSFAKCQTADYLTGFAHRYRGGHDLFLDICSTFKGQGLKETIHQAGHILLTDFPTKAGIPIPGFSQSGLGGLLQEWGISSGWLQLNVCDTTVGIIAVAESHPELCDALDGLIEMNSSTFFDTFVEGSLELTFAYLWQNPVLLFAGLENITTGFITTWQTYSIYVNPLEFFGAGITSALIGFFITRILKSDNKNLAYLNAIKSGAIGLSFVINPAFGFGAVLAVLSFQFGKYLAKKKETVSSVKIDINKTELFLNCLINPNENSVNIILEKSNILYSAENIFEVANNTISENSNTLHVKEQILEK